MKHVMIDIETLGNDHEYKIVSLGAVKFETWPESESENSMYWDVATADQYVGVEDLERHMPLRTTRTFYQVIDINSMPELEIDQDTLCWWMSQGESAKKLFSVIGMDLSDALRELKEWLGDVDSTLFWSRGSDYDLERLRVLYKNRFGSKPPWSHKNVRCHRTFIDQLKQFLKLRDFSRTIEHHALCDAIRQAAQVQRAYEQLFRLTGEQYDVKKVSDVS